MSFIIFTNHYQLLHFLFFLIITITPSSLSQSQPNQVTNFCDYLQLIQTSLFSWLSSFLYFQIFIYKCSVLTNIWIVEFSFVKLELDTESPHVELHHHPTSCWSKVVLLSMLITNRLLMFMSKTASLLLLIQLSRLEMMYMSLMQLASLLCQVRPFFLTCSVANSY